MANELEKLRMEMEKLVAEVYEGERRILVFGEGRIGSKLMLIGEAPGEQETLQKRPFVGKAGKIWMNFWRWPAWIAAISM